MRRFYDENTTGTLFTGVEAASRHHTIEDGFGVAETARRLSISMKTLANWVTQYRLDKHKFALKPGVSEQDAELARLKKENARCVWSATF